MFLAVKHIPLGWIRVCSSHLRPWGKGVKTGHLSPPHSRIPEYKLLFDCWGPGVRVKVGIPFKASLETVQHFQSSVENDFFKGIIEEPGVSLMKIQQGK